jgi:cobalt-zinc-cadmium efflux system outer membrane protein
MGMGVRALAVCAIVCVSADGAAAQGKAMTLADVLARARTQAPRVVSARLAVEEARARLAGASIRQGNPDLEGWVGNRRGTTERFTDFEFGIAQGFEPGARRTARVDGANAAIAQGTAAVDEVTRMVLHEAAGAFYRAVHAAERIALLDAASGLASSVYSAADRRYRAGDIAVLDVNIARVSLARVRADREAAEAARSQAVGDLRRLLGLDGELRVAGSLSPPAPVDLAAMIEAASRRPELRVLEAAIQEADADRALGLTFLKPEYGLGARYAREEGDHIVLGALTVTLPLFSNGQEQRAAGAARGARLRSDLEAARTRIASEVRAAYDAYGRRLAAVRLLEADAISGLDENEQLTTRSFEAGQIGLPDLLLLRREMLDTRFQHLDALLEAALARVDLDAGAGMLR